MSAVTVMAAKVRQGLSKTDLVHDAALNKLKFRL